MAWNSGWMGSFCVKWPSKSVDILYYNNYFNKRFRHFLLNFHFFFPLFCQPIVWRFALNALNFSIGNSVVARTRCISVMQSHLCQDYITISDVSWDNGKSIWYLTEIIKPLTAKWIHRIYIRVQSPTAWWMHDLHRCGVYMPIYYHMSQLFKSFIFFLIFFLLRLSVFPWSCSNCNLSVIYK